MLVCMRSQPNLLTYSPPGLFIPMLRASNTSHLFASMLLVLVLGLAGFLVEPNLAIGLLSVVMLLFTIFITSSSPICSASAFIFGSALFFVVRPLYIVLVGEYNNVSTKFQSVFSLDIVYQGLFLTTLCSLFFVMGSRSLWILSIRKNPGIGNFVSPVTRYLPSLSLVLFAIGSSLVASSTVYIFNSYGKGTLYSSSLGAYAYQFPILLQGINLVAGVLAYERFAFSKKYFSFFCFISSALLITASSILMRDISIFRAFYLAGLFSFILSIAYIRSIKQSRPLQMKLFMLIVIILLPFFTFLGSQRLLTNDALLSGDNPFQVNDILFAYVSFFSEKGDMNMFDTFLVAMQYQPSFYPYLWSWLYVPLHLIPRFIWIAKPVAGITQDLSFLNGAPYSPGLAGFFLLDGGVLWMLASMFVLGLILSRLDVFILNIKDLSIRAILASVITVYSMFLPRYFLWQFVYGVLALILPSLLTYKILNAKNHLKTP